MKTSIIFFFSLRFLKPKRSFIPNISVLMSSMAIAISVAVLIIVTSVMNGFTADLIDRILGLNSHITIYSYANQFDDLSKIRKQINGIDGVKFSFPVISGSGMIIKENATAGVFIKGITKQDIESNKDLKKSIIANLNNFEDYTIILGKDIARQLRVRKNDIISIVVPVVANTMFGMIPRQVQLKIIGVIDSHSQQYDNYMAIVPFDIGQIIFNMQKNASCFEIITKNPEDLAGIESEIIKVGNYYISDWKLENNALLHALKIEANVMSFILGLFVIVSAFTIFAVIRMMIKSKERDIAILKAHGVSNRQIKTIFFIVGFVICIIGLLIGNIFGVWFSLNVDNIRLFLETLLNTKLFDGNVYLLSNLPSRILISDIIKTNIFAFIVSLLCIYFSVKRNVKINIVKILRNN